MKLLPSLLALLLTGCANMPIKWTFAFEHNDSRIEVGVETPASGKSPARTYSK